MVRASLLCYPFSLQSLLPVWSPVSATTEGLGEVNRGEKVENPVCAFASAENGRLKGLVCS